MTTLAEILDKPDFAPFHDIGKEVNGMFLVQVHLTPRYFFAYIKLCTYYKNIKPLLCSS